MSSSNSTKIQHSLVRGNKKSKKKKQQQRNQSVHAILFRKGKSMIKISFLGSIAKENNFFYGALVLGQSLCSSGTWLLFRATCCTFLPLLSRALVWLIIPIVCHVFMLTFSAIIYHVNWPVLIHCHARIRWVTFRHVPNLNPYLGRPRLIVKFTGMIQTPNLICRTMPSLFVLMQVHDHLCACFLERRDLRDAKMNYTNSCILFGKFDFRTEVARQSNLFLGSTHI